MPRFVGMPSERPEWQPEVIAPPAMLVGFPAF